VSAYSPIDFVLAAGSVKVQQSFLNVLYLFLIDFWGRLRSCPGWRRQLIKSTELGFEVLLRVLVGSFWGHTKRFNHFKKLIFSRTKNPDACTYLSEPDHIYRINCPDYWFCFFIVRLLNAKVYCRNYTDNKSNFYTRFVIIPDI